MDVDAFLRELRNDPEYAGQIVFTRDEPARPARFADAAIPTSTFLRQTLARAGIQRLYRHQGAAVEAACAGEDVLVATGTASGKTLCYTLPILETLARDPSSRALLLFPTKALCQDQFAKFGVLLEQAGLGRHLAGICDGDSPAELRRRLRDHGSIVFSNPDMLHAGILPQHGRWARFLGELDHLVLDELHVYSGIFGSNMAHLLTRFFRLCDHYGSRPRLTACSATIANPKDLADRLTGRTFHLVDEDGSPRGRRVTVFWNPPRIRERVWRSRRSANVEAHELMARLVARGVPTITFSKARMTAEMIHRYVTEALRRTAPDKAARVTPYRGGYRPEERREIEARLFRGELLGVSTTPALELGIDVGGLEAAIVVGYPGTLASFFQQAGRAGRKEADALIVLVGLDTSVNQYVQSRPDYIFGRAIEEAVIDPFNPFVITGHLRCAAHELPLRPDDVPHFGTHAETALRVLEENRKVRCLDGTWYHASAEVPQHEVSLRDYADANVVIQDADTGAALGEVNRYDAEPILHPEAIYMHRGDTYRVLTLDLARNIATVKREEVDYYTQPLGGTDVHHVDHKLREKPFGTGTVCWGEVTAYFRTVAYEKIHFYSLDAISTHGLDLPTLVLETMAFWIVPPDEVLEEVRRAGLDAHSGLRAVGYATRMLLPLFMTCDTLDFSHTVGSVNSPWQAIFVYERYPHGLGFTEKAYTAMHRILPAVLEHVRSCPCEEGCPCCVGKPLRQRTTWNVERGEAAIPSKAAAIRILEGLLGDGQDLEHPDRSALADGDDALRNRLEQALRRRLEVMREPQVFHPIAAMPDVRLGYPDREADASLPEADVSRRTERRSAFEKDLHKRLAKKLSPGGLPPHTAPGRAPEVTGVRDGSVMPPGMRTRAGNLRPDAFPGRPETPTGNGHPPPAPLPPAATDADAPRPGSIVAGDPAAAKARARLRDSRNREGDANAAPENGSSSAYLDRPRPRGQ
ncbi:MAG: DEAD/DEAH box helicase [Lentisphaeria bacterium]|nr:DEAD/DEAH box helicase [Lentisphaeria bacterium]